MDFYVNENIPIPNNLPKRLRETIDELMETKAKNDIAAFDCLIPFLETSIKSYHIAGKISRKDALQLMDRFGL